MSFTVELILNIGHFLGFGLRVLQRTWVWLNIHESESHRSNYLYVSVAWLNPCEMYSGS